MDSTLIAYVAEALEGMDHALDYDSAADMAAGLLRDSAAVHEAAERYGQCKLTGAELREIVAAHL